MNDLISHVACKCLAAALGDSAIVVNLRGEIVAANAGASEILAEAPEGRQLALFLRSPDLLNALSGTLEDGEVRQADVVMRAKVPRTLEARISPLGRDGEGALALVVLRDRTREAQVERIRSDFVANASHELRTPLTVLSGFIETMQGAARQDEKARGEFLNVMKAQAARMSRLIDDLLSLSRIELDEHIAPNDTADLAAVVNQAMNLLHPLAKESACELVAALPSRLMVRGDAGQLAQVIHNLIENAVKYSGAGKRVSVTGRVEGGLAIVSIEDNGPGIAAHHVPRLTERFYRVSTEASRMRGGTGLGLAICKHIINRHRGRLVIESEPGKGSIFSMHLPSYT